MQIQTFDQFEFGSGGSSEYWVAIATESKGLRGRNKELDDFFKVTEAYECFSNWNKKTFDRSSKMSLDQAANGISFELDYLIPWVKKRAGLNLTKKQIVFLLYNEWCQLDIVWEDQGFNYRLMWGTTA